MEHAMFNAKIQAVMDKVNALRDKVDDHWQIPRDEALLLAQLVRVGRCKSICEVGMSYGYSTLHLAAATAEVDGHMHSFDISPKKIAAAGAHLAEAGLSHVVSQHEGDARVLLKAVTPNDPYDFVFIDAVKEQSLDYLTALLHKVASQVTIITDNTTSHAKELASFVAHLRAMKGCVSCGVNIGNGFELSVLRRA
jgi:predicted O-methyltransferase YrrM